MYIGPRELQIEGKTFQTDEWTNVPDSILASVPRRLHQQKNHPITITRQLIESRFPGFRTYNSLFPVVTVEENFDSLGFPPDHPGRNRTDTYYINKDAVLRTHTSAHQAEVFRANASDGFLISQDVYRKDAIDRTHFPIFHQMEAAYTWDRAAARSDKDLAEKIWEDLHSIPKHDLTVIDESPAHHPERNPVQNDQGHTPEQAEAIVAHLKRSLENVVVEVFGQARKARQAAGLEVSSEPLTVRWLEDYFPFTSPSWQLEVSWQGDWLELLGSGVVKQDLLNNAGVPDRIGWAFGLGLERIAMLLYSIPDIRLFWSQDPRFLSQFTSPFPDDPSSTTATKALTSDYQLKPFSAFSKYPPAPRDVAFWLPSTSSAAGGRVETFHENNVMEIVREIAGSDVEDVRLIDEFTHPKTSRKSVCYRINYRSLERTLTNNEANDLHKSIRSALIDKLGVELR